MDMKVTKLREIVKDREAWRAAVSSQGRKESDTTERLNNSNNNVGEETPGLSVQSVHDHVLSQPQVFLYHCLHAHHAPIPG